MRSRQVVPSVRLAPRRDSGRAPPPRRQRPPIPSLLPPTQTYLHCTYHTPDTLQGVCRTVAGAAPLLLTAAVIALLLASAAAARAPGSPPSPAANAAAPPDPLNGTTTLAEGAKPSCAMCGGKRALKGRPPDPTETLFVSHMPNAFMFATEEMVMLVNPGAEGVLITDGRVYSFYAPERNCVSPPPAFTARMLLHLALSNSPACARPSPPRSLLSAVKG